MCLNEEQRRKDAFDWNAIVRALTELQEMHTVFSGKSFILCSQLK